MADAAGAGERDSRAPVCGLPESGRVCPTPLGLSLLFFTPSHILFPPSLPAAFQRTFVLAVRTLDAITGKPAMPCNFLSSSLFNPYVPLVCSSVVRRHPPLPSRIQFLWPFGPRDGAQRRVSQAIMLNACARLWQIPLGQIAYGRFRACGRNACTT